MQIVFNIAAKINNLHENAASSPYKNGENRSILF
jgi:hypothetical protein